MSKSKKSSKKDLTTTYWIIAAAIFIVAIFFISIFFINQSKKFEYRGLEFTEEKFGEIPIYHTYWYYQSIKGKGPIKYNLYLRNDPRTNDIPIEGEISLLRGKKAYISVGTSSGLDCEQSRLAVGQLTTYLRDNEITVSGAVPNKEQAEELGVEYVTCETHPNNSVIMIRAGNETRIDSNKYCHLIQVSECQILEAVEKFQTEAFLQAKERTEAENSKSLY